jgi:hypothetical protein
VSVQLAGGVPKWIIATFSAFAIIVVAVNAISRVKKVFCNRLIVIWLNIVQNKFFFSKKKSNFLKKISLYFSKDFTMKLFKLLDGQKISGIKSGNQIVISPYDYFKQRYN